MSAPHLIRLNQEWCLWRTFCLRGSGFPVELVLELAAEVMPLADRVFALRDELLRSRQAAIAAAQQISPGLPREIAKALGKVVKQLESNKTLSATFDHPQLSPALEAIRRAEKELEDLQGGLQNALTDDDIRASHVLRRIARDPRFREAVAWQNPGALTGSIAGLLRAPEGARDADNRQREAVVANYLQRYCTKNDTIGFFGPVGWGKFDSEFEGVEFRSGRELLSKRTVYFEHWTIDALGAKLAEDPQIRPWIAPRRMPTIHIEGNILYSPIDNQAELPPDYAFLLSTMDGEIPAIELASRAGVDEPDEIYEMLEELVEKKLVVWTLDTPCQLFHPENDLRRALMKIGDETARARALSVLELLEAKRAAVAQAAGDADALARAITELDTTFAELTGKEAARKAGQNAAGRTPIYEDCRRDVELVFGRELVERLAPPLSLVLSSARWFSHHIAQKYRAYFLEKHAELTAASGDPEIKYLKFFEAVADQLPLNQQEEVPIVRDASALLRSKWFDLIRADAAQKRVDLSSADLAGPVAEAFSAPDPGWPTARYDSPDLLIAAPSVEAIRAGNYTVVLGELHAATYPLAPVLVEQHPDPESLIRSYEADILFPCVAPFPRRADATRANVGSLASIDVHVETTDLRSWRPRDRVVAVGEMVVDRDGDRLVVRTRDRRWSFEMVAYFENYLAVACSARFQIFSPARHTPRVTVDNLVLCRERWSFDAKELTFTAAATPKDRFLAALSWMREKELPRFVFYKVPEEPKPLFLDFYSPTFVELATRIIRRASTVAITEMLPTPDQTWLTDAEGRRYTSELRCVGLSE